jgi:diguanylate cyclase (GGDEF)-like protein
VWAYLTARASYWSGLPLDGLYVFGFVLVAITATAHRRGLLAETTRHRSRTKVRLVMMAAIFTVLIGAEAQTSIDPGLANVAAVAVAFLVLAQTFAQLESENLRRDLEETSAALSHEASHDPLTGLCNRHVFQATLEQELRTSPESRVAVLFIDIDRFKELNDTFGHEAGDAALRLAADRTRSVLRSSDTAARFGGDEFVILVAPVAGEEEVIGLTERLLATFDRPFELPSGDLVHATISVGVNIADGRTSSRDVLRDADLALLEAKHRGRARYELATPRLRQRAEHRAAVARELADALEADRFDIALQPIVETATGLIVGAEALLRLRSTEGDDIPPSVFIPIAEETGLIIALGRWVLWKACRTAAAWPRDGKLLHVSVNVSARQLTTSFSTDVESALSETGLLPEQLLLEVTESSLVEDAAAAARTLGHLNELGVRIAVDDFGTGYSSLGQLRTLPIDVLKIDQSFIRGLGVHSADDRIVQAAIDLAHGAHLAIVAEGVETTAQLAHLKAIGCDYIQGYLVGMPVPPSTFPPANRTRVAVAARS